MGEYGDYVQALIQLSPTGDLWTIESGSVLHNLYTALAVELERIDTRVLELLDEADPQTTTELIDEWEEMCGLPTACVTPTILGERRAAIVARLRGSLGQSPSAYQQIAEAVGYDRIAWDKHPYPPFKVGISQVGDQLNTLWHYVWKCYYIADSTSLDTLLRCNIRSNVRLHSYVQFHEEEYGAWNQQTPDASFTNIFFGAANDGKRYIICGQNQTTNRPRVQTSEDGVTWTDQTTQTPGSARTAYAVTTGNNRIIIGGTSGHAQESLDGGVTWTDISATGNGIYGLCHAPELSLHVAVGSNCIFTRPDTGGSWTARTIAGGYTNQFNDVCWAPDLTLLVAVGFNGEIQTSPDGINWTQRVTGGGSGDTLRGVAYYYPQDSDYGTFVAVGNGGKIFTSLDGITWTARTAAGSYSGNFYGVRHNGLWSFVAVGASGECQVSHDDGITWEQLTLDGPPVVQLNGLTWMENYGWVVIGASAEIQQNEVTLRT
jgi:uncharacterized protein YmfQ (DUF2313 family)/photosystem II stability/assembly factor-like uncharacterized protein